MNGHPKDTGNMGHRQHGTQDTEKKKIKTNSMKHYITGIYCTNVHSNLK